MCPSPTPPKVLREKRWWVLAAPALAWWVPQLSCSQADPSSPVLGDHHMAPACRQPSLFGVALEVTPHRVKQELCWCLIALGASAAQATLHASYGSFGLRKI